MRRFAHMVLNRVPVSLRYGHQKDISTEFPRPRKAISILFIINRQERMFYGEHIAHAMFHGER